MNTIKFDTKNKPLMIAHRGVSGLERENTCPAFVVAGVKSYYGIETDVHVTRDGEIIVFHDDTLTRLLGIDKVVEECDFEYLRSLLMFDRDDKTQRKDLFLPTLQEYMSICKKYGKQAILELKNPMKREYIQKIVDIIRGMDMFEKTTFISFAGENLVFLKQIDSSADAQFLSCDVNQEVIDFILKTGVGADIYFKSLTKEFIELMHENKRTVNCWTVDSLEDAKVLKELGVDQITSNILE